MKPKILICGTRKKGYQGIVIAKLCSVKKERDFEIIEGCCPNSADEYAEEYAKGENIKIYHYPAISGKYLTRNIEMVTACDEVIAFWDGFSYGTAQTIATAIKQHKPVTIVELR